MLGSATACKARIRSVAAAVPQAAALQQGEGATSHHPAEVQHGRHSEGGGGGGGAWKTACQKALRCAFASQLEP